jgi:type IV secretory pathway VirB10-like protein
MPPQISRCRSAFVACALALVVGACERAGTGGPSQATQTGTPRASLPAAGTAPEPRAPLDQAAQAAVPSGPESSRVETPPAPGGASPPAARAAEAQAEQLNELRPRPQSVTVGRLPAPVATPDLRGRDRRLAAREAALAAREQRLRQREDDGQPALRALPGAGPDAVEPAAAEAMPAPAPRPEDGAPRAETVTVAAGTTFEVEFAKGLASNTTAVGDTFRARVVSDVLQDGAVAIPAGSEVLGVVTDAAGVRRIGGQAKLALSFTDLVLPSGTTVSIHATFLEQGKSKAGRDAATIGGATAGGAILGRILGQGNRGKGTIIGAIIGAAAGTAIAARSAGDEVVIPEGAVVHIRLTDPVDLAARR